MCQLLNEHGIEYHIDYDLNCIEWLNGNTVLSALPMENGNVAVQAINELTPEQAVKVTLGYYETCRITTQDNYAETEGMGDVWIECNKCHWQTSLEPIMPEINYCPGCGRKVER